MEINSTTLTGIQMVTLCLRLVALWLLVRAFQVAGVVFAIQNIVGEPSAKLWATETAALFVGFAVAIWFFARPIARFLYPPENAEETVPFTAETMLRVGCCLLGFWTFTTALPSAGRLIVAAYLNARADYAIQPSTDEPLQTVYVLVELVVAMVLVFGNRAVYRLTLGREAQS